MDRHAIPTSYDPESDDALAPASYLKVPWLGSQFLTIQDYLLRNFTLFRYEAAHQIRQDIRDTVCKLNPVYMAPPHDKTVISGNARMALPIDKVYDTRA